MPKSFDPALASAPPETDIVRAVYEGLTETDAKTLQAVPAIAVEWKSSDDFKTWTFTLRKDARWSNGERVTAKDFARSWKRLAAMGGRVSHQELLRNIVGLKSVAVPEIPLRIEEKDAEIFRDYSLIKKNRYRIIKPTQTHLPLLHRKLRPRRLSPIRKPNRNPTVKSRLSRSLAWRRRIISRS